MREIKIIHVAALTLLIVGLLTTEVASFGCYSCWSNVTVECAVGPIVDAPREECPETDLSCVTAIVNLQTVRGCSSSINLPSSYPLKDVCTFEYCNSNIYPSDRLYCYKCQGNECSQPTGKSRPCLKYSPNDECYTDVVNATYTLRGCLSDGNYTATEYTRTCQGNLCNSLPSEETLECLTCTSNDTLDCIRPADGSGECEISLNSTCSLNVLLGRPANCYTYQNGDFVERGCGAPVDNSSEYVTSCTENDCNAACIPQSVCYTCDSAVDPDCSTDLSKLVPETCSMQAISSCFTCLGEDNNITYRGCSSSLRQPLNEELSTICQTEYCNHEIYPANRLSCFKCSGEDCSAPRGNSRPCLNYDPNDKCYMEVIDETNTIRGCLSDGNFTISASTSSCSGDLCNDDILLTATTCFVCDSTTDENCLRNANVTSVGICSGEDDNSCFTCLGQDGGVSRGCGNFSTDSANQCTTCTDTNCNIESILECYECSSENVNNCNKLDNTTATNTCLTPHCIAKITATGVTERGCHTESFICEPTDLHCNMCPDSLCNDEPTPEGSFKCHECDDGLCAYLNGTETLEICAILGTGECYQYYDIRGSMVRGCTGDNNTQNCLEAGEECYKCRKSGCNDIPLTRSNNLTCINCLDADKCLWGFEATSGASCNFNLLYYQSAVCYTALTFLNIVGRGCLPSIYDCPSFGVECDFCTTNNCNYANAVWQRCLHCTSEDSESCEDGTHEAENCPGDLITFEQRGCYMMRKGDYITRGCTYELSQTDQEYCSSSNSKNCTTCYGQGCNNQKANSSAAIRASFYLSMLMALFCFLKIN